MHMTTTQAAVAAAGERAAEHLVIHERAVPTSAVAAGTQSIDRSRFIVPAAASYCSC
jgi:hypothetical protein